MPGDTLLIQGAEDTTMIPDSLLAVGQPPVQLSVHRTVPHHHSWIVLEILVFMFAGIPILVWLGKKYRRYRLHQAALEGLDSHFAQYDQALSEYNSYYRSLSPTLRRRFQLRVAEFMETKKFEYVDTTPEAAIDSWRLWASGISHCEEYSSTFSTRITGVDVSGSVSKAGNLKKYRGRRLCRIHRTQKMTFKSAGL